MKKNIKVNAAILIIGNEILSGRTQEKNVAFLSNWLNSKCGISVEEVRIIPDKQNTISKNVVQLSKTFNYVFTTGGIGPTHDDITAQSISKAFKVNLTKNDLSMPEQNNWKDQPTLELARQMSETSGFCFLDKDKHGDLKNLEDLQYISAMSTPGGGRQDIPNRLKRHFFVFAMTQPSIAAINEIYGQMLKGRFADNFGKNFTNRTHWGS